ncbi:MFS transporter [Alicyclobacillus tolerans]|uniref:MFS transporter n=1 Tax=Alicyclobacillus tolerans TaxID=90970 RepID=UPI001F38A1C5|nr:MFS transporter [Alicyclobacillus tolerans]MCF8567343.1 MFS transporter [Alicyclobacillus tolerans]
MSVTGVELGRGMIAARVNRLPMTKLHGRIVVILSLVFLFELGDLNTFGYAAPALIKYWGLKVSQVGLIVSASFLGMFLGALVGGWFADRVGRRNALMWATVCYSIFSLVNAFTSTPGALEVVRLLTGVGMEAMTVVGLTYVSEMFPKDVRGRYQSLILGIGLLGIPMMAWFARFVVPTGPDGWRWIFVLGAVGLIVTVLIRRYLPESPRWLEVHGRSEEAEQVLVRLERSIEEVIGRPLPEPQSGEEVVLTEKVRVSELFSKDLRKRTIILSLAWIVGILGFYGFVAWVPTLLVEHGYSVVQSLTFSSVISLGAVPGALLAWPITDRFGRKESILFIEILIAIFVILYGMMFNTTTVVIFGFLSALLLQTQTALLYAYTPEIFPTRLRGIGAGFTDGLGRLANVGGGVLVAAIYGGLGYLAVFIYVAAAFLIEGVLLGVFGEKTAKRELERIAK